MSKTVTAPTTKYEISFITEGQGEEIFALTDPKETNRALIAACLNAADGGSRTVDDAKALPMPDFYFLLPECLDINGLKIKGEAQAAVNPTTDSPTTASE